MGFSPANSVAKRQQRDCTDKILAGKRKKRTLHTTQNGRNSVSRSIVTCRFVSVHFTVVDMQLRRTSYHRLKWYYGVLISQTVVCDCIASSHICLHRLLRQRRLSECPTN